MPLLNELVLVDTNVFIAKWVADDVIYQQLDSSSFFDSAKICHYCIGMSEITLAETNNKFPYLIPQLQEFLKELLKQNKFCRVEEEIIESEVIKVKKDALSKGFQISKQDAFIALLANKKRLILVSFDQDLIDYCKEIGWKAEYPTNLINLETNDG